MPYSLHDLDPEQDDASNEVLLVELRAPDGTGGWMDDRTLESVLHAGCLYSLSALRRLVQSRVDLGGAGFHWKSVRNKLYKVCDPLPGSKLLVVVIPVADLQALPLVSGEDPPQKRSG